MTPNIDFKWCEIERIWPIIAPFLDHHFTISQFESTQESFYS